MALRYPRPSAGNEPLTMRQLREWGKDVVDELLRKRLHGDGRRVAVTSDRGGTAVTYMEDPEPMTAFLGFWARGQRFGASGDKVTVRPGTVRWMTYTDTIGTQTLTAPAAGAGTLYHWVEITCADDSVTAAWDAGAAYPTLISGDTIYWPIGRIVERSTAGTWEWYQDWIGDINIVLPTCLALKLLGSYSESVQQILGHTDAGACNWYGVSECTTTTTTTTTAA